MRLGILAAAALAACSAPPVSTTPPPTIANHAPVTDGAPTVTEQAWPEADPPEEMSCTAEPPSGGILDRTSRVFSRIAVRRGKYVIEERASYRQGPVEEVTVITGGCAHVGTSYRFVVPAVAGHPSTESAFYLTKAVELVTALPFRKDVERDYRESIVDMLRNRPDDTCSYADTEISTVECSIDNEHGKVVVELAYSIAL